MKTANWRRVTGWVLAGAVALSTLSTLLAAPPAGGADEMATVNGGVLQTVETPTGAVTGARNEMVMGGTNAIYYAIAITMGLSCVAAGYAVGHVGAAALGVISEKPELLGRTLIFVGLAEGIAIYGLIIAIMLLQKA